MNVESNERYQSIFETTLDGIIVINTRGIIEDINSAGLALFQYPKAELLGNNIKMLMPEPDRSKHDGYIHNYRNTRKPKIIGIGREVEGLKKDGTVFPFRLAVSEFETEGFQFFTGVIHDLTQRNLQERIIRGYAEELEERVEQRTLDLKKEIELKEIAQKALVESQRLYETISKNYPNGTISVIDNDYNTIFVEGSELKRLGLNPDDLVGSDYRVNIPLSWRSVVEDKLLYAFRGEEQDFEYGENDSIYRVRCVPLSVVGDEVEQVLIVENNISPEKKAEKEMYAALNKEKQLNQLKTNFVSMASHEFRTPLSSILSSAALVGKYKETHQQENRMKHLGKIRKNVQNLTMILNDFLSLERIEGGYVQDNPEPLDIEDFLQNIAEETKPLLKAEQKISVTNNLASTVCMVDPFLLRNVLINLLSNAIKYSDKDIDLLAQGHDSIEISVIDKGIGISEVDQEQLFGRFFRASNAGQIQGTGLGLNIVKRYVDLMNANITFESTLGKGSIFKLILDARN